MHSTSASKQEQRDDEMRNRILVSLTKKDVTVLGKAMEDYEKAFKESKFSKLDDNLMQLAQNQKELLEFRDSKLLSNLKN